MTEIREVAVRLFVARNMHTWPPQVTARTGWQARYSAEADGVDVLSTMDDAVVWANEFIAQIEAAARH